MLPVFQYPEMLIGSRTGLVIHVRGFLQNSRSLGDLLKNIPYFSEYSAKRWLKSYNILGEVSRAVRQVGVYHDG